MVSFVLSEFYFSPKLRNNSKLFYYYYGSNIEAYKKEQ